MEGNALATDTVEPLGAEDVAGHADNGSERPVGVGVAAGGLAGGNAERSHGPGGLELRGASRASPEADAGLEALGTSCDGSHFYFKGLTCQKPGKHNN